jgi:DNA-binding MarR family transcriptional regulator
MTVDPLEKYVGYLLKRAAASTISPLIRRLSTLQLRPTDATVVLFIQANPGITQGTLSRSLDMASANMTPLIARLARRELIKRVPVDGRSHGLILAAQGRALATRIQRITSAHEKRLARRIPAAQRDGLIEALRRLWRES